VLVDILVLTSLYIIRVVAGAVAGNIELSFWLLAFSMFIFLSLALIKRCAELLVIKQQKGKKKKARGYQTQDLEYITSMGIASGYLAVLVMALYIHSDDVVILYDKPAVLWLICPVLLYWVSRMWLLTGRCEMHDDPLVFTLKDRHSHFVAVLVGLILIGAF
jgi:4-hydroxybenzoate polyprenyltransferase